MAVNLRKGERVNLSSESNRVSGVIVGLGWDSAKEGSASVDCDASAIICGTDGKAYDVIYFGKMRGENDSVIYTGDSQTGEGNGDNERIYVNFTKLPQNIGKIVISANIYDAKAKRQHFGMINNAYVRVVNWKTSQEMCRFNLTDNYSGMTGIVAAEIFRTSAGWDFLPIGKAVQEASRLESIVRLYR
ncbi:MAG: TerD family protein [Clostridia bacterium]|nr:TerD family protein [Clostridia bacterium]